MLTTRGRVAVLAGLLLITVGCAQATAGSPATTTSAATPVADAAWHSCPPGSSPFNRDAAAEPPLLPAAFTPVTAIVCRTTDRQRPGGGTDEVAVEDRATGIAGLVAALRLPSEPKSDGICPADLIAAPWLALIDAEGHWIRVSAPVDGCGKPRPEFLAAFNALHTTRVSAHVLRTIVSDGAAASGCGQDYSDMAWATLANEPARTAAPTAIPSPSGPVKVCTFDVPKSEQGGGKPGADYESSYTLSAPQWTAASALFAKLGTPAACHTYASRIAVLADGTVVELDGCRYVLVGDEVRQGTPALVALLG